MYTRNAELLEHIVQQQRARLEQISLELTRAKKEARICLTGFGFCSRP